MGSSSLRSANATGAYLTTSSHSSVNVSFSVHNADTITGGVFSIVYLSSPGDSVGDCMRTRRQYAHICLPNGCIAFPRVITPDATIQVAFQRLPIQGNYCLSGVNMILDLFSCRCAPTPDNGDRPISRDVRHWFSSHCAARPICSAGAVGWQATDRTATKNKAVSG
jgi:hypothetical protein